MTFSGQRVLEGVGVFIASQLCTTAMLAWLGQHTYLADNKCFAENLFVRCQYADLSESELMSSL